MALLSASLDCARDWAECALNLAFPWPETTAADPVRIERPFCRQCCEPFPALETYASDFLCYHCVEQTWHFQWARSAYRTEGQVLEAVIGFKYRDESYQYGRLVTWLTEVFDQYAASESWHGLVPVPLYHRRRRERGFNQAYEIARGLGKKRKIPVLDCLYRYRETVSQTRLERAARRENMNGAFRLKAGFDATGQRLLLIDDVLTTGATVNACAQALTQAGAGPLAVLTIARS
jgi:ComF family protein